MMKKRRILAKITFALIYVCLGMPTDMMAQETTRISGTIKGIDDTLLQGATWNMYVVKEADGYGNAYANTVKYTSDIVNRTFTIDAEESDAFFYVYFELEGLPPVQKVDLGMNRTRLFLMKKGFGVSFVMSKDTVSFLGKGAGLLACQYRLLHTWKVDYRDANDQYNKGNFAKSFSLKHQKIMHHLGLKLDILAFYKKELPEQALERIRIDLFSKDYHQFLRSLRITYTCCLSDIGKKEARNFFVSDLYRKDLPFGDSAHVLASPYYINFLFEKELTGLTLLQAGRAAYPSIFPELAKQIGERYNGDIRDRLLILGFKEGKGNKEVMAFFDQTLGKMVNETNREKLIALRDRYAGGKKVVSFALKDEQGKMYTPGDFLGKTVLLDFWFVGCIPCRILGPDLESFMQRYEDRDDILLVSVNTDKNKKLWKQAIEEGVYTSKKVLNLNTDGLDNEMLTTYDVNTFPRLMIFDKMGRVVTIHAPKPISEKNIQELMRFLE